MRYLILSSLRKYARALRAAARPALRMAAWNALFVISGLLLIALMGEAYFRLTNPFIETNIPSQFVDGVGVIRQPNAEARYANWRDGNFVVSHTNNQGFLDREPVSAERAAAGCHIAFIGDSFVEAREVSIADKFHVRLEEMAARELPRLDIGTQAYGITNTGQINQIPFYDEYARRLNPKLVVLVFYFSDFANNITAVQSMDYVADPDRLPYMSAQKDDSGTLKLRPPDATYPQFQLPKEQKRGYAGYWNRLRRVSYFAKWLDTKNLIPLGKYPPPPAEWEDMIAQRSCCAWMLDEYQSASWHSVYRLYMEERLPSVYEDALEYTAFGIDQFKRRAERDGATLIILAATGDMGTPGDPQFDRLSAIAEPRGIPIISDYAYIVSQGNDPKDGQWDNDAHWNAVGHQWAAEAVLEWLKANRDVCE